jgi:hypothetical protein
VALALYQSEHGQAAPLLDALVPGVLPELPDDPFANAPFHYRVSRGERIGWPRAGGTGELVPRDLPAGQGVLWSVGPDRADDGGQQQWDEGAPRGLGRDLIFLVPAGPGK